MNAQYILDSLKSSPRRNWERYFIMLIYNQNVILSPYNKIKFTYEGYYETHENLKILTILI